MLRESMERKIMEEFIEIYRSEPSLWKVKSIYYNNKAVKSAAYNRLCEKLKEVYHDADIELVKKKINALRTNFRKEVRKVESSRERNKMTGDPIYAPTLWYYDLFQFIADQENELRASGEGNLNAQDLLSVNMSENEYYVESDGDFEEEGTNHIPIESMERKIMKEFIEIYRQEQSLWKVKSLYYSNRTVRNAAHHRLCEKLKELYHDADVELVKKKINVLRTNFRKEVRKVEASRERNKMTGDPIYVPTLWYYDLFQFIVDQENELRASGEGNSSSQDLLGVNTNEMMYYLESDGEFEEEFQMSSPESQKLLDADSNSQNLPAIRYQPTPSGTKRKRNTSVPMEEWYPDTELQRFDTAESESDHEVFGHYVASKLSKMDRPMQQLSERLISEILFRGQTRCLDRFTTITDGLRNVTKHEFPQSYLNQ